MVFLYLFFCDFYVLLCSIRNATLQLQFELNNINSCSYFIGEHIYGRKYCFFFHKWHSWPIKLEEYILRWDFLLVNIIKHLKLQSLFTWNVKPNNQKTWAFIYWCILQHDAEPIQHHLETREKACSQARGNVANVRSSRQGAKKLPFLSGCNF